MSKARFLLFTLLLIGCGGSGGGGSTFVQGSSGSIALSYVAGTDYNGNAAVFGTATTVDGSAGNGLITATVSDGTRTIEVGLVGEALNSEAVVDLAGTTGSAIVYSDPSGKWNATSGTVTVQSRTSTAVQLLLTNVILTASAKGATGTVTISGPLTFASS